MALFNLKHFITLLLIDKIEDFRNSYSLVKILSWKFDILEVAELTNELTAAKLLTKNVVNGISYYKITEEGISYIEQHMDKAKHLLLSQYPNEKEFIDSLLS